MGSSLFGFAPPEAEGLGPDYSQNFLDRQECYDFLNTKRPVS